MNMNDKPIISYFKIIGLHGYKDVVIDFDSPVRIVIAENGAGKTTILLAMYYFLTCKFSSLKTIDFEEIICKFNGSSEKISLRKESLAEITHGTHDILEDILEYSGANESELIFYLTTEFEREDKQSMRVSNIARSVYVNSPWNWDDVHIIFSNLCDHYKESVNDEIMDVVQKVKAAIGDIEVLYLPTYRRIEKLLDQDEAHTPKKRHYLQKSKLGQSSPITSEMNYGLSDVEHRLAALTDDVQRKTNIGYRQISASIIDDLLAGKESTASLDLSKLPELKTLKLFLSRIGGVNHKDDSYLERIQQIYNNENHKGESDRSTLIYFLSKLSQVVDQTKQLESTIENFVLKANTYLGNTSDVKSFNYDPDRMSVTVINKWTSDEVKLNDLSSGEKQVVSLLSYLFLYPTEKIILVDEPELSLSIDWQQKILVDMVEAPSCKQLLAITHSPFVFDNELDCYGSSLKITRTEKDNK